MPSLTALFRTKTDSRLESLRAVIQQNEAESEWREGFYRKAESLSRAAQNAADELAKNPSEETAQQFLDARRDLLGADALVATSNLAIPAIRARAVARLKPVLPAAIQAVVEKLEKEREEVSRRDTETARDLGLGESETTSPIVKRIEQEIQNGENLLKRLGELDTPDKLNCVVTFCLE